MASAKAYLSKGEARSAVIELKTVLQKQPDSAEARFLLGKALLIGEDPVGAAVELRKALELKHPQDLVLPELARAMLEQGQHKEIIAQFSGTSPADKGAAASLKTTLALAHMRIGAGAEAMAAFKQALEAVPGYVPALTGTARQLAVSGDREGALKLNSETTASGKADADSWV
ncbi:MAG: tetratricopeptide repeat protein, partial [Pseudomonadota bacterium]